MSIIGVLTLPTIAHLMVVDDHRFVEDNTEVTKAGERLRRLLARPASPDFQESANFIWAAALLEFALEIVDTKQYRLQDVGLTERDIAREGHEIPCGCDHRNPRDRNFFADIQRRFGKAGFRGLQIYVWWNLQAGGGFALSEVGRESGAVWLEALTLRERGRGPQRLVAHELGHFLTLQHPAPPLENSRRLMTPEYEGPELTPEEITRAAAHARRVMGA
jgi:hypothetical protein